MSMQFGGRRARSVPAVAGLVLVLVAGAGCKGKTQTKDSQETLDRLASLEAQLKDKDSYIQKLRDENAELQRGSAGTGAPGEWVFVIEGDALTIKGKPSGGGGGGEQIDDATATAMSKQFLGMIDRSRGAIQKCYEQALKKSTGLQARTVTLTLNASFSASGAFSRVTFSPELPAGFDTCLRGVASKWKLPEAKAAMTFQASVKLTPT